MMAALKALAQDLGLWTPTPTSHALDTADREIDEYEREIQQVRRMLEARGRLRTRKAERDGC